LGALTRCNLSIAPGYLSWLNRGLSQDYYAQFKAVPIEPGQPGFSQADWIFNTGGVY
jgi:hypothetical protein